MNTFLLKSNKIKAKLIQFTKLKIGKSQITTTNIFKSNEKYKSIFEYGLDKDYFQKTNQNINVYIKEFNYSKAIEEYSLLIHHIKTYLDLSVETTRRFLLNHLLKQAELYLKIGNTDLSFNIIEDIVQNHIRKYSQSENMSDMFFDEMIEKIDVSLKRIYDYQVSFLEFNSSINQKISECIFNQDYLQLINELIILRKVLDEKAAVLSEIIKKEQNLRMSIIDSTVMDNLLYTKERLLHQIINKSLYIQNGNELNRIGEYILSEIKKSKDSGALKKYNKGYLKEVNLIEREIIIEDIQENLVFEYIKALVENKKGKDLANETNKSLLEIIYKTHDLYNKTKSSIRTDFEIDYLLLLFKSVNEYVKAYGISQDIIKLMIEVMENCQESNVYNNTNIRYYNIQKYVFIKKAIPYMEANGLCHDVVYSRFKSFEEILKSIRYTK